MGGPKVLAIKILAACFFVITACFYFWRADQEQMTPQEKAEDDMAGTW
jgi:hypothetical protein